MSSGKTRRTVGCLNQVDDYPISDAGRALAGVLRAATIGVPIHEMPGHLQRTRPRLISCRENLMAPSMVYWISKFAETSWADAGFYGDEPKPQVAALGWYLYLQVRQRKLGLKLDTDQQANGFNVDKRVVALARYVRPGSGCNRPGRTFTCNILQR